MIFVQPPARMRVPLPPFVLGHVVQLIQIHDPPHE